MDDRLRVGVVGTSGYAEISHLPRLATYSRASLVAICGRRRERAEEMAKQFGVPGVFTDYREMIDQAGLDAIVVSVPDDLHYPVTMDALDAGLHVLCEKPLALTADQAREMYEKAEAAGVKHMVCFTYRWIPDRRYLKMLIDDGYIGRCFHCCLRYVGAYRRPTQYRWRRDRQRSLGALGDLGSHVIDLAHWYVGDIAKVSAHLGFFLEHTGPEWEDHLPANDTVQLNVVFENGVQGAIHVSWLAHVGSRSQEHSVVLYGEDGTLEADMSFLGTEIRGLRSGEQAFETLSVPDELWGTVDRSKPPFARGLEVFLSQPVGDRLFVDSILDDRPVVPSFYDGLKVQEVIDAAIQSHEQECWITL